MYIKNVLSSKIYILLFFSTRYVSKKHILINKTRLGNPVQPFCLRLARPSSYTSIYLEVLRLCGRQRLGPNKGTYRPTLRAVQAGWSATCYTILSPSDEHDNDCLSPRAAPLVLV